MLCEHNTYLSTYPESFMSNKMDNIFDIYSAKVDNNKVTEWDSKMLFPD